MKRWMVVLVMTALLAGSAFAKTEVQLKGLNYSDVTITAVNEDGISFRIFNNTVLTKSYDEINRIILGGNGDQNALDDAERTFSTGKYAQAAEEYQKLLASKDDAVKTIAKGRLAVAKQRSGAVVTPKTPGGDTPPPATGTCYVCRGVGTIACADCQGSGQARCKTCEGSKVFGRIVCPRCNGNWRGDKCKYCDGKGKITYPSYAGDGISMIRKYTCRNCDGDGWFNVCDCRKEKIPGTVVCPDCKGTGKAGACTACNGTKKVPCRVCKKGEPVTSAPTTTKPVDPPVPSPTPVAMAPTPTPTPTATTSAPAPKGEKLQFFSLETQTDNVVYVIDRASSMTDFMEDVRQEVIRSISDLNRRQSFHLLFCADGRPMEKTTRLVDATPDNKTAAQRYAMSITARGATDHVAALRRAVELLANAEGSTCVVFLTDGPIKDGDKVLSMLKEANKDRKIAVHTVLIGNNSEEATKSLSDIATQNGGTFKKH